MFFFFDSRDSRADGGGFFYTPRRKNRHKNTVVWETYTSPVGDWLVSWWRGGVSAFSALRKKKRGGTKLKMTGGAVAGLLLVVEWTVIVVGDVGVTSRTAAPPERGRKVPGCPNSVCRDDVLRACGGTVRCGLAPLTHPRPHASTITRRPKQVARGQQLQEGFVQQLRGELCGWACEERVRVRGSVGRCARVIDAQTPPWQIRISSLIATEAAAKLDARPGGRESPNHVPWKVARLFPPMTVLPTTPRRARISDAYRPTHQQTHRALTLGQRHVLRRRDAGRLGGQRRRARARRRRQRRRGRQQAVQGGADSSRHVLCVCGLKLLV